MQTQINFTGKKDRRISFAVDDELESLLRIVTKKLNRDDISCLVREYAIECAVRDFGIIKLKEARGEKSFVDMAKS